MENSKSMINFESWLILYFVLSCVVTSEFYRKVFPLSAAIICGAVVVLLSIVVRGAGRIYVDKIIVLSALQVFIILFVGFFITKGEFKDQNQVYLKNLIILAFLYLISEIMRKIPSKDTKRIVRLYFVMMMLCTFCTLYVELTGPIDVIRQTIRGTFYESVLPYGHFDFIYMLNVVFTALIIYLKNNARKLSGFIKSIIVLMSVLMFIVIALSGYTTAFALSLFSLFLCIIIDKKNKLLYIALFALLMIVFSNIIADFIQKLPLSVLTTSRLANSFLSLTGHSTGTTYLTGVGQRFDRIKWSMEIFLKYPLTGGYFNNTSLEFGSHSEWTDALAKYGLIFIIIHFAFWINVYKKEKQNNIKLEKEIKCSYLVFFLTGFLNPISMTVTAAPLFLFVPFMNQVFLKCEDT